MQPHSGFGTLFAKQPNLSTIPNNQSIGFLSA